MSRRYKMIVSAPRAYREVELEHTETNMSIGTFVNADVRFREQDFEAPFSFNIVFEKEKWFIRCSEGVSVFDRNNPVRRAIEIKPGDETVFVFANSGRLAFTVYFHIDYEYEIKKYDKLISLEGVREARIGKMAGCQIQLPESCDILGNLLVQRQGNQFVLKTENAGYGVRVNGQEFRGEMSLSYLDYFSMGEFSFCFRDGNIYTDSRNRITYSGVMTADEPESLSHHTYPKFNRSTRIEKVLSTEKIKVLDPPAQPQKPHSNIVLQLLPAVLMLAVVVLIRGNMAQGSMAFILMSVCTMGIGILTSVMSIISERKKYKEDVQQRRTAYESYIEEKKKAIEGYRKEEAEILEDTYYSISKELRIVDGFLPNLFERRVGEKDFLEVRLGTGSRQTVREIDYKQQEKVEALDELQQIPEKIAEEYKMLQNVPVTMKLEDYSVIGVTGSRDALYNVLKVLTMDLAVRHYYSDVKFLYSIDEKDCNKFKWLCMLPHVHNDVLNRRNLICDEESKNVLMEYLYRELSRRNKDTKIPRVVVFVYRGQGIQTHPLSELMYNAKEKGMTLIFFSEYPEHLPRGCEQIIQMEDYLHGIKIDSKDGTKRDPFVLSVLEDGAMSHTARRLAPVYCEEISLEGTLTKNISFFELLGIYKPEDVDLVKNWMSNKVYESMAAPLGVKAKNQMIYLNLHEKAHGPHGLVAGTTGSGKSEILQTYILSMAMRYHPYEVAFVLIDFKGGGMANQFEKLPHLVGTISNIDGKEINRSLLSIRAELNKRQEIFKEYNVNHIDAYIKLFRKGEVKNPLPHLIIIVDEFAELKAEQPEFMKELISAARIGRSLGVHLILATQKPSGVVDPQIWSNSRFKLCLKVQTKEDSNEVLKSPVAVEITEPGRAYLQVGNNEIFELFQSAYSGGSSKIEGLEQKKEYKISKVSMTGKRTVVFEHKPIKEQRDEDGNEKIETQLKSVVNYVGQYCEARRIARLPYICQPPLPEKIMAKTLKRCTDLTEGMAAYIGKYDDPSRQYQGVLDFNVTEENTIIIGSSQNGKTNLLQTMIRSLTEQYSPNELNLYILDFASKVLKNFEELHHVGGVVCSNEDEKCKNLFKLLEEEVKVRRDRLAKAGVSSFASYLEAGFKDMPQIVVMIDNLTAMRELYLLENDFLLPLCREGNAVGISFVVANSQTTGIGYKYLANFRNRLALYCNDSAEYNALFESSRMRPEAVPGRCLIEKEKHIYEAQTYLAFDGEKEIERVEQIKKFVATQNQNYPESYAKIIPVVPPVVTEAILRKNFHCESTSNEMVLGLNYSTVAPVMLNWMQQNILALCGKKELGRMQFVLYMMNYFRKQKAEVYILDNFSGELEMYENVSGVELYSKQANDVGEMLKDIYTNLSERYGRIMEGEKEFLSEEPLLVLLINNREAITSISANKENLTMYKEILAKYKNLKSCIVYTDLENAAIGFNSPEAIKTLRDNRQYVIFENIEDIKLTDIPLSLKKKYMKPLENGEVYWLQENALMKVKMVQIEE